jgi:hypothetical protein
MDWLATLAGVPDWLKTLVASVIGGLIATVANSLATAWAEKRKRTQDAKSLRAALCAEVRGLLDLTEARGYVGLGQAALAELEAGHPVPLPRIPFAERTLSDQFPVFMKSIDKLGLLSSEEATLVVAFYGRVDSLRFELSSWNEAHDHLPTAQKAEMLKGELALFAEAKAKGEEFLKAAARA